MPRSTDGAFGQAETKPRLALAGFFDRDRPHDITLSFAQSSQQTADVKVIEPSFDLLEGQRIDDVGDRNIDRTSTPPQCVNQLVANENGDPWSDRARRIQCSSFEVDCQKDLLHDVFCVAVRYTTSCAASSRYCTQMKRYRREESPISFSVSRDRGSHPHRQVMFALRAVHARLPLKLLLIWFNGDAKGMVAKRHSLWL